MVQVNIPSTLRLLTNGAAKIDADGSTLGEIVGAMEQRFPGIRERLCNREELRRFFRFAINDDIIIEKQWADFRVCPNDTITIVPAIAGG